MYNSNGSSVPILMHFSFLSLIAGMSRGAPHDPDGQHEVIIVAESERDVDVCFLLAVRAVVRFEIGREDVSCMM